MNSLLAKRNVEFHSFDKKTLKVVLKRKLQEVTGEEVNEDLEAKNYTVQKITGMHNVNINNNKSVIK